MIPEKIQKNPINLPYLPIYSHFTFCHSYFSQFVARFICFLQQVLNGFAATFGKCAGQLQGQSLGEPRGTISSLIIPRKFHSAQQPKKLRIIHGQPRALPSATLKINLPNQVWGANGTGRPWKNHMAAGTSWACSSPRAVAWRQIQKRQPEACFMRLNVTIQFIPTKRYDEPHSIT